MKTLIRNAFLPTTIDNSPVNYPRYYGKLSAKYTAYLTGLYGSVFLVGAAYNLWCKKIEELEKENENLKEYIDQLKS